MKEVNRYEYKFYITSKKYTRIVALYAEETGVSLDDALKIFYHSEVYRLISEGVSDMHCMSDGYLVQELIEENKSI